MGLRVPLLSLLLLVSSRAEGQRELRLLAVGELPPFRQVVEDGVRRELPALPGSVPPRRVEVRLESPTGERVVGECELRLGRVSEPLALAAGRAVVVLADGERDWARIPIEESGDLLVVLRRAADDWHEVRALVVADGGGPGSVTVINACPASLMVTLGERVGLLAAGGSQRGRITAAAPLGLGVAIPSAEGPRRVLASSLELRDGERALVVLHPASGARSRQPVKALVRKEPADEGAE